MSESKDNPASESDGVSGTEAATDASERVATGAEVSGTTAEPSPVDSASQSPPRTSGRRGPGVTGVLALLLAIAALALAARPWWPGAQSSRQAGLDARFDALDQQQVALGERTDRATAMARDALERAAAQAGSAEQLAADLATAEQRLDTLRTRLERQAGDQNADLEALRARIEAVESSVSRRLEQFALEQARFSGNLADAGRDLADRLLLIELQRLFATAADLAETLHDAPAARAVWQRAMDRLQALDDARFAELRRHAGEAMRQLEQAGSPQSDGIQRLVAMADRVARWPVRGAADPGSSSPASDSAQSSRWQGLRNLFDDLVRVEPLAADRLSPAQLALEQAAIAAALNTVALAQARGDGATARSLAGTVAADVERVFEAEDPDVAAALDWLREFSQSEASGLRAPAIAETRAEIQRLIRLEES